MTRPVRILTLILIAASSATSMNGCSVRIENGLFGCQVDEDCPSGWTCRDDRRCWDSPGPLAARDATTAHDDATTSARDDAATTSDDATADDATTDDATAAHDDATTTHDDATVPPDDATAPPDDDATITPDDATTHDDATTARADATPRDADPLDTGTGRADATPRDTGVDAGACAPTAGQSCTRAGFCGAVINCDGLCAGGSPPPTCPCGPAACSTNGTWLCETPPNLGAQCTAGGRCGGTIDCAAQCTGGTLPPTCPCGPATCQANGTWSTCPVPAGYSMSCGASTLCGGTIDCTGLCDGTPLPTCPQCGTPSCINGCAMGTCDANSTCLARNGTCMCTVDECSCNGAGGTCGRCINGQLGTCADDAFGCGDFTGATTCAFGCDVGGTACACSPDTNAPCEAQTCACGCGDFIRPGITQCDGSCTPVGVGCAGICRANCGRDDPGPL